MLTAMAARGRVPRRLARCPWVLKGALPLGASTTNANAEPLVRSLAGSRHVVRGKYHGGIACCEPLNHLLERGSYYSCRTRYQIIDYCFGHCCDEAEGHKGRHGAWPSTARYGKTGAQTWDPCAGAVTTCPLQLA